MPRHAGLDSLIIVDRNFPYELPSLPSRLRNPPLLSMNQRSQIGRLTEDTRSFSRSGQFACKAISFSDSLSLEHSSLVLIFGYGLQLRPLYDGYLMEA